MPRQARNAAPGDTERLSSVMSLTSTSGCTVGNADQQVRQAHALVLEIVRHHGSTPACASVASGTRRRSSGAIAMSRKAPDNTPANTGAATSPP